MRYRSDTAVVKPCSGASGLILQKTCFSGSAKGLRPMFDVEKCRCRSARVTRTFCPPWPGCRRTLPHAYLTALHNELGQKLIQGLCAASIRHASQRAQLVSVSVYHRRQVAAAWRHQDFAPFLPGECGAQWHSCTPSGDIVTSSHCGTRESCSGVQTSPIR